MSMHPQNQNAMTIQEKETIAETLLERAMEYKSNHQIYNCIQTHIQRMTLCPIYSKIDAVRLLGAPTSYTNDRNANIIDEFIVKEIPNDGIFDIFPVTMESPNNPFDNKTNNKMADNCNSSNHFFIHENDQHTDIKYDTKKYKYRPSFNACILGKQIQTLFLSYGYTYSKCQSFLLPFMVHTNDNMPTPPIRHRLFSGNSFFNHRLDFYLSEWMEKDELDHNEKPLLILVSLFLFGLAMEKSLIMDTIGESNTKLLVNASLLCHCPNTNKIDSSLSDQCMVANVQIYPISPSNFNIPSNTANDQNIIHKSNPMKHCLFMSDWPLESLRSSKFAIMPVGYDTLELLSLSAHYNNNNNNNNNNNKDIRNENNRILDLCCGNGIQGLFAWMVSKNVNNSINQEKDFHHKKDDIKNELISIDINQRACLFVTANIALNQLGNEPICVLHGDLFDPFLHCTSSQRFSQILCNPPFVAVPSSSKSNDDIYPLNSLYAVAGIDGMDVVQKIVYKCWDFLQTNNNNCNNTDINTHLSPMLLMVTEVPNVEDSCQMIQQFLPPSKQTDTQIRIAYVEDDVESIDDYIRVRSQEKGWNNDNLSLDWEQLRQWNTDQYYPAVEIRNRALVLISISKWNNTKENIPLHQICKFSYNSSNNVLVDKDEPESFDMDNADEEDAFLTMEGMAFTRTSIFS